MCADNLGVGGGGGGGGGPPPPPPGAGGPSPPRPPPPRPSAAASGSSSRRQPRSCTSPAYVSRVPVPVGSSVEIAFHSTPGWLIRKTSRRSASSSVRSTSSLPLIGPLASRN